MVLARDPEPPMIVLGQHRSNVVHVREIWIYRELLGSLVRKELKVRYKGSALGFLWSMVQPLFMLAVYALAFSVLGAGFDRFAIWLMCGLLVWNMVSTSMMMATRSITDNGNLVGKIRFPRAILPLAAVGAALVHFVLQLIAFAVVLVLLRQSVDLEFVWLIPFVAFVTVLLCSALGLLLAALNVYARDTQHLLDLATLAWFWLTPILYPYDRVAQWLANQGFPPWLAMANPLTPLVITMQRAVYGTSFVGDTMLLPAEGPLWYLRNILIIGTAAFLMLLVALRMFDRAEGNFAEAL
jgi:ABC-2 type transport system permease protein